MGASEEWPTAFPSLPLQAAIQPIPPTGRSNGDQQSCVRPPLCWPSVLTCSRLVCQLDAFTGRGATRHMPASGAPRGLEAASLSTLTLTYRRGLHHRGPAAAVRQLIGP